MASKASMLKTSARKTGTGLFAGMKPIAEEEPKESLVKEEKKPVEIEKTEPVEEVKAEEKVQQSVVEEVQIKEQPVVEQPVQNIEPVQEMPQQPVYTMPQQPVQVVQQPVQNVVPVQNIQQPVQQIQQPQQVYVAPVQNVQPIVQPTEQPKVKETTAKTEKSSRYEKEKFLLLDIRGLRDYVEHMAKASNMSATKYIRNLIEIDMQQNMDIYEAHKALEERLKERR